MRQMPLILVKTLNRGAKHACGMSSVAPQSVKLCPKMVSHHKERNFVGLFVLTNEIDWIFTKILL